MTYRPNLYPDIPIHKPGTYSYTGMGAALNASIAAALAAGRNGLKVAEGPIYCDVPIVMPNTGFDLVGLGRIYPNSGGEPGVGNTSPSNYLGGVKLIGPYGGATSALKLAGGAGALTVSSTGCRNARIENIAFAGLYANADVFGAQSGPVPLVDIENAYKFIFSECCFVSDYGQLLKIYNSWDSDFWNTSCFAAGCNDPTVTADSTAVQKYTGRSFLAVETAIGRSLGVPAIEIISPNASGGDVSNNIDFYGFHYETNAENGLPILIRGGNGNNVVFAQGSKIEARDGCNPLIVVQDMAHFKWDGLLYGAGVGTAPNTVGSLATGTAWKGYTNPGLLLLHNCLSPRIMGAMGYDGYGGGGSQATAPLTAFVRCISTTDPQINIGIESGLDSLIAGSGGTGGARIIFDACTDVSTTFTRAYASAYIKGLASTHGTTQERTAINGTTTVA